MEAYVIINCLIGLIIIILFVKLEGNVSDLRDCAKYDFYYRRIAQFKTLRNSANPEDMIQAQRYLQDAIYFRLFTVKPSLRNKVYNDLQAQHKSDFESVSLPFPAAKF